MNIAFDSIAILGYMSRNRGIGNYALSQFSGMVNRDGKNKYFFLNMIDRNFSLSPMITNDNFTEDFIDTGKNNVLLRSEIYSDIIGNVIKRYIRENNIDIFYITSPFEHSFIQYKKEWFTGVKVIATVYDIIPYVMKEKYLSDKNTYDWYMKCVDNLRWADRLFVISDSVKNDLVNYLQFSPENIHTIWGAVDDRYRIINIDNSEKSLMLDKFGITKPFIMCTGGEDSRKNLDGLIRAYSLLPDNIRNSYQLVVVCKLSENGLKNLKSVAVSHNVGNDVIFTGFVSDEELLKFYNLATLMAFPSKYEGFGLPIVEAWACGTPVLTADNSSLREIAGDSAMLINADIDQSIADGMKKMLSNKTILFEYTAKGMKRVELYRWDKINDNIISLINDININKVNLSKDENKKTKIAFFTPLPPLESGISDYSYDIINALSRYFDIDVFVEETYNADCNFPENVSLYSHRSYPIRYQNYKDTVFQMGNSEYHFYMYQYIRKYHGTVVLHDYNLHGAFYHYAVTLCKGNYSLYQTFIDNDFPDCDNYINALRNGSANPDLYGMELNSYITDSADRIIVHSQYSRKKLLEKNIARNVTVIPLYAEILPLTESKSVKIKNNFPTDKTIISAFGGIHRTKRIIPLLKAFSELKKEINNIHLMLVGKPAPDIQAELENFITSGNLQDCVTITGYTSIEKFKEYIDMSDICMNLRYPYNGETSGSLMRILAKGKCAVVNDTGSFSEIPDNACMKIPSVEKMGELNESGEIYKALKELVENITVRTNIEKNARKYAENVLDINKIAVKYFNTISSDKNKSPVTEEIINTLKNDINFTSGDIQGIARTLSYSKRK
ncbi:MAG: glycosyltransferase [Ruminococcus sp.]|nr:glycosyltransferase [Ruminococcus sp.]